GPILAKLSGLTQGKDFKLGYSPERSNPGDKEHTLGRIVKVVSGEDLPTLNRVADAYGGIIQAGVHRASSIKVAEAAKVIENTQRDLNIALMNELAIIFERLHIRTADVLEAAGTKWNFLKFRPGLVGGHCIGVDPYYLTMKAHQQQRRPLRRAAAGEDADRAGLPGEGGAHRRPGPDVQGRLQRPAQQQGARHPRGAAPVRHRPAH